MMYELDIFHLVWIVGLFGVAGILGMLIGSTTSMRTSRKRHAAVMREKNCVCPCHGTCACHSCGKPVDKSI